MDFDWFRPCLNYLFFGEELNLDITNPRIEIKVVRKRANDEMKYLGRVTFETNIILTALERKYLYESK